MTESCFPVTARLLDGRKIAEAQLERLKEQVHVRLAAGKSPPGLAVILVGNDPASHVYVNNKRRAAEKVGILSRDFDLSSKTSQGELRCLVEQLNQDPHIHGILIQLPLPHDLDARPLIELISPAKDVDGFHPQNVGHLALRQRGLRPCTPRGIMTLLEQTQQPLRGLNATIVGASNHVGRPMALELLMAGCTVRCCHKFTPASVLAIAVAEADILVVAVGKPGIIPGQWVKIGAIVIDVGINRQEDGRIVGDVEFESALGRAGWLTPVPGGVGPMTVATLMQNTFEAAENLD